MLFFQEAHRNAHPPMGMVTRACAWWARRNSAAFVQFLRRMGCAVGDGCVFYEPRTTLVDLTRPYLIELGERVYVTRGVLILTHGFEWVVLQNIHKRPYGNCAKVRIGNNVFIGMNSIILKGVSIGDNCIIGAGAVVSHDIPGGCVAVGNPARPMMDLAEFEEKMAQRQDFEARAQALAFLERHNRLPTREGFDKSYFHLFHDRKGPFNPAIRRQLGRFEDEFRKLPHPYDSFEAFLEAAMADEDMDKRGSDAI